MTVYAAIAGMLALMGFVVFYSSLDNPHLEQAQISLQSVEVRNVNTIQNKATLEVTFMVENPSEKTFTVPLITYELYGDGRLIGSGQYSTEDIAMPGRAAFYGGSAIPLKSMMTITSDDTGAGIYGDVTGSRIAQYEATGMIMVESAWAIVEVDFESSIP
ncbi:MAG: hypothetical protein J4G04_06745 [Nitrosopumilaceae archaeon]|nr:hypothetical protein [Nitrosopumilaceae archaeon]